MNTRHPTADERVRARIKQWVHSRGLTQIEIARRIGRNQAWFSRYLSGDTEATLETLEAIALAFELPFRALFDVPEDEEEAELLGYYRALKPRDRKNLLEVLKSWSSPRRPQRSQPLSGPRRGPAPEPPPADDATERADRPPRK